MTYQQLAARYNVSPEFIWKLIQAESGWNPQAKNPYSSARGLIQFIDSTARDLGYLSSLDLVTKHPTIESQLAGPVKKYWDRWAPFRDEVDLAACNFYPAYRNKPDALLPENVRKVNPGLTTIRSYYNRIAGIKNSNASNGGNSIFLVIAGIVAAMTLT